MTTAVHHVIETATGGRHASTWVDLSGAERLRVVPDVHGDVGALSPVLDSSADAFVLFLGDLVDRGPDSGATLELALDWVDAGRAAILLGNHEWKLLRAVQGRAVQLSPIHEASLAQIARRPGLETRFACWGETAPLFAAGQGWMFAHAGFDPAMMTLREDCAASSTPLPKRTYERLRGRALFGAPTGRVDAAGHPERSLDWVRELPPGMQMVVGHDCRSNSHVLRVAGDSNGAAAYLLDLGAGMGGPLGWLDLDFPEGRHRFSHPMAPYDHGGEKGDPA